MAITTLDALIGGLQTPVDYFKIGIAMKAAGTFYSLFYAPGYPGAAVISTAGIGGEALTSYPGQIPFPAAVGGQEIRLARVVASQSNAIGIITIADRLWHNNAYSVTSTGAQTINSVTLPARDKNGTTAGEGVNLALEVAATLGAGTPTFTVTYTNSAGTGGRTGTIGPISTTNGVGMFWPMAMQAGDTGVRSIQTIQSSATMTSGSVAFVLYRPLVSIPTPVLNIGFDRDAVALGMPKLWDNTVPFVFGQATTTSATTLDLDVSYAQG